MKAENNFFLFFFLGVGCTHTQGESGKARARFGKKGMKEGGAIILD